MRTSIKRILAGATLGLFCLAGCDPNPNGPTFPDLPVAKDGSDTPDAPGAPKGKGGRKVAPAGLINDPAK